MSYYKGRVWNESITLYNRYQTLVSGKMTTKWNKTVLTDCFFGHQKNQTVDGLTIVSNNTFVVRIPANSAYLSPEAYYALATKTGKFTIKKGDIIVRGSVTDTLADNDSGSALLTKYFGRAFTVNRAVDNSKLTYTGHYMASEEKQWR